MTDRKVSIAICGGGVGGLTFANALSKLDNVTFDLYEGKASIEGSGLVFGLGPNAQRALELTGVDVRATLNESRALDMDPVLEIRMGNGPDLHKLIHYIGGEHSTAQMERKPFIDSLIRHVPRERLHAGKKLVSITEEEDHSYTLAFEDGTSATADAIVGFDGVHSVVRKHVLGDKDHALSPRFGGVMGYWTVVPMDRALQVLGKESIPNTQRVWYGRDSYLLYNPADAGSTLMIAGCKTLEKPWPSDARAQTMSAEQVASHFGEGWGTFGPQMAELFVDPATGTATAFAFGLHDDASTFFRTSACVAGDAAHPMQPFQGAGAGQAIEDALVLTRVLAQVKNRADLPAAFAGYDHVRRPRSQAVVASSNNMGLLGMGRDGHVNNDFEKLQAVLPTAWDHIFYLDTEAHCKEAVDHMMQVKKAQDV